MDPTMRPQRSGALANVTPDALRLLEAVGVAVSGYVADAIEIFLYGTGFEIWRRIVLRAERPRGARRVQPAAARVEVFTTACTVPHNARLPHQNQA
jgi:hypothetical protein